MNLADPLDDSTWTNENMSYTGQIRSAYSDVPQDKWDRIFGKKLNVRIRRKWQVVYILNLATEVSSNGGVKDTATVELTQSVSPQLKKLAAVPLKWLRSHKMQGAGNIE